MTLNHRLTGWCMPLLLLGIMSGCGSHNDRDSVEEGDAGSSGFVQDLSGRFSVSLTAENEAILHYVAPDGVSLHNVEVRAIPMWRLQSVLDGMQEPTAHIDVHWDSLGPDESRAIDLGEPPQLNDGVTSVAIEGTAELQGSPVRFAIEQRR